MSPSASPKTARTDVLRSVARRLGDWWRAPVPQRTGAHVGHSGGWGRHAGAAARW